MKYIDKEFDIDTIIKVSEEFTYDFSPDEKIYLQFVMDPDFLIWPMMSSDGKDQIPGLPQHIFNVSPKQYLLMMLEDNDSQYLIDLPEVIGSELIQWKTIAVTNQYHAKAITLEQAGIMETKYDFFTLASIKHEMVKNQLNTPWFISDIGNPEAYLHKKLPVSNSIASYCAIIQTNARALYDLLKIWKKPPSEPMG